MKRNIPLFLSFLMALGAFSAQAKDTTTRKDVLKETKDLLKTIKGYSEAKKEDIKSTLEKDLSEMKSELNAMKNHAKDETSEKVAELEKSINTAEKQLNRVQNATAKSWDDVTDHLAKALFDIDRNYDNLMADKNK